MKREELLEEIKSVFESGIPEKFIKESPLKPCPAQTFEGRRDWTKYDFLERHIVDTSNNPKLGENFRALILTKPLVIIDGYEIQERILKSITEFTKKKPRLIKTSKVEEKGMEIS